MLKSSIHVKINSAQSLIPVYRSQMPAGISKMFLFADYTTNKNEAALFSIDTFALK